MSAKTFKVKWGALTEPDILGYSVERRLKKTGLPESAPTTTNITGPPLEMADGWITATEYIRFTIRAMDTAGNVSDPSPTITFRPNDTSTTPTPTNLSVTAGDRSARVDWNAVTADDLAGYYVERSATQTGTYVRLNDYLLTTPEFLDTGLTNGTTYWYRVRAVDTRIDKTGSVSAPLGPASVTPVDSAPPGKLCAPLRNSDRFSI